MDTFMQEITETLIAGNSARIVELCGQALEKGIKVNDVMDKGLFPGMDVVGQRMKTGEMFIPEVLMSAKAMQAGMERMKDALGEGEEINKGTVIIGTVQGDLHDIGKNLVTMLLEGVGFKVVDMGVDIKPEQFVAAINEHNADIVAMSALLTTTMPKMEETIKAITEAGLRDKVKIIAGGAPVNQEFVDHIGADAYGANAAAAADRAKELITA